MKVCSRCHVEKPLDRFFNNRLGRHVAACRDCTAEAHRDYDKRNIEKRRVVAREWRRQNPERVKAGQDRWRARNPGEAARRTAIWRAANRERALAAQRACNRKLKDAAYAAYGGYQCACCPETIEAFLSLDHVNNDGAEDRRKNDRRKLYKWLEREGYQPGFQVLCMNATLGRRATAECARIAHLLANPLPLLWTPQHRPHALRIVRTLRLVEVAGLGQLCRDSPQREALPVKPLGDFLAGGVLNSSPAQRMSNSVRGFLCGTN
jgi:hypothetical protein